MMDSLHTLKNAHESAEFDSDAEAELLTRTTTPYSRNPSGPPSPQAGTSTAASTPPPGALSDIDGPSCATSARDTDEEKDDETENGDLNATLPLTVDELNSQRRFERLQFVLRQSAVYSSVLAERMEEEKAKQRALRESKLKEASDGKVGNKRGRGKEDTTGRGKKQRLSNGGKGAAVGVEQQDTNTEETSTFQQPALITGAKLKPYQLDGVQWMVSLDQNGISGILADEMGLGKTLQTIAFSAYLRERGNSRPFLVVCPLSVLHNWQEEYAKFAPSIPVCVYHGSPEHRAELRQTVMALPGHMRAAQPSKPAPGRPKKKTEAVQRRQSAPSLRRSSRAHKTAVVESEEEEEEEKPTRRTHAPRGAARADAYQHAPEGAEFPIVVTTYEMIIRDRTHLQNYDWGYIVVDEGHRLKNLDCKLMQEIKKYSSAGRMILTGTPLHNNLAELWSLLNFILPDIFDDLENFQQWFNLEDLQSSLPTTQSQQIISSLHAILKPFLLRRLKVDVEMNLPPKKEYVLYAPLTVRQREAYDRVLDGGIRSWLVGGGTSDATKDVAALKMETERAKEDAKMALSMEQEASSDEEPLSGHKDTPKSARVSKRLAKVGRKSYALDGSDTEYFAMLHRGEIDEHGIKPVKTKEEQEEEHERMIKDHATRTKMKQVNNMKLQNTVMQLRKVCSHPFLFDWPVDPNTGYPILGEELLNASGKMMVLNRLLGELFKRGHKVLLFSQFTTMLDIIEDWATDYMGWKICRIDGKTSLDERRAQMNLFQTAGDAPDAPRLFLLSTRAGGLGINLVAADTVIFYDQDWNPQMDAQAQDRAHRIGQTKPVLIFRLVSAHTIETKIMQRATEKRKLEALVIAKGKFKMPAAAAGTLNTAASRKETMAEMAASLLRLEGEKIEVVPNTEEGKMGVLSDADLDVLLDRRPEVFVDRGDGWAGSSQEKKTTFAVYQAPVEEGNDALANMLSEESVAP